MAQAMLATEQLPEELQAPIIQKAAENPFFIEELCRLSHSPALTRPIRPQSELFMADFTRETSI